MRGIDVSENNGVVDWGAVKANGFDFAIIRIGYGRGNQIVNSITILMALLTPVQQLAYIIIPML